MRAVVLTTLAMTLGGLSPIRAHHGSFISYDRGARLITGPLYREPDQPRAERPVRETQTI